MAKVYHAKELCKFLPKLKTELEKNFAGCRKIAVKIHFGEPGNEYIFKPEDIKPITDVLTELGYDFFLFDTPVAYAGPRTDPVVYMNTIKEQGWDRLGQVRISDEHITVKGENMNYEVAKELTDADGVLVVTHFKGHVCSGFGGAIKNLGMGALTKKTKGDIHAGAKPEIVGKCIKCGACVKACPIDGIRLEEKPVFEKCFGCSNCVTACPENVLKVKLNYFDTLLSEGAAKAASKFKKAYYVSYLVRISRVCDCSTMENKIIADDNGFLASSDGVAIDKAGYDIVVKQAGEDVFLKHNKKSGLEHVKEAERFGMGKMNYELEKST